MTNWAFILHVLHLELRMLKGISSKMLHSVYRLVSCISSYCTSLVWPCKITILLVARYVLLLVTEHKNDFFVQIRSVQQLVQVNWIETPCHSRIAVLPQKLKFTRMPKIFLALANILSWCCWDTGCEIKSVYTFIISSLWDASSWRQEIISLASNSC